MALSSLFTQGGGSSATSSSRAGDIGPLSFGGFGGVSFGNDVDGVDPRWLIGGAVALVLLLALLLKKGR